MRRFFYAHMPNNYLHLVETNLTMKPLYLLALIILTGITTRCKNCGNTINNEIAETGDNSKYLIVFDKTAPVNDSSDIGVDWKTEKPVSEFGLNGVTQLSYRFELLNDSIAVLSQKINSVWEEQDRFKFQPWHWIIEDSLVISNFEIKDFDKDGDVDLLCCVMSNINGNEWTYIYLNDGNKLIKLYNTADEDYIWDNPRYDHKTKTINTELYASAYGISNTASYRLEGTKAFPLTKEEEDTATKTDAFTHTTYKGKMVNGSL